MVLAKLVERGRQLGCLRVPEQHHDPVARGIPYRAEARVGKARRRQSRERILVLLARGRNSGRAALDGHQRCERRVLLQTAISVNVQRGASGDA